MIAHGIFILSSAVHSQRFSQLRAAATGVEISRPKSLDLQNYKASDHPGVAAVARIEMPSEANFMGGSGSQ